MTKTVAKNITLEKIISTIGALPASPAIVSAVMGLTSNLDSKVTDVSKVLSSDQSLTAKVLKLSNSSFYGRSKEVKSLQEAVLVLGFFTVRSMVIATSAYSMYSKGSGEGPGTKLWRHSLSTAIAARQVAQHIKHPEKEEVFIAALLHDIGKLVLLQRLSSRYREVVWEVEENKDAFFDVESRLLGFTHCDVALILLEKWSFPTSLTNAIYKHHRPPAFEQGQTVPIAHIINLGNHLAKTLDVGFNDRRVDNLAELESARLAAIDKAALDHIVEEFREYYQAEVSIFEET